MTHTISATVIAGIGYATLRAFECHPDEIDVPSEFEAVFILAAGVVWEILEFASAGLASITGTRAPLGVVGIDDIVSDMIFNTAGAVIVAAWGTGYVGGVVAFFSRRLHSESED